MFLHSEDNNRELSDLVEAKVKRATRHDYGVFKKNPELAIKYAKLVKRMKLKIVKVE